MQDHLTTKSLSLILLLFISYAFDSKAQNINSPSPAKNFVVKSWRNDKTRISEKNIALSLGQEVNEYEIEVLSLNQHQVFRLQLARMYVSTPTEQSIPCWEVALKEIVEDSNGVGKIPSYNLLSPDGPNDVGDRFWATFICPIEKPRKFFDGNLYPIRAKREFLIDKFRFSFEVTDYSFNKKKNRLDKLAAILTFTNQ